MKNILQKLAGSLNTKIPINTVPTAPIPVQTAYAVPIGSVWVALINSNILMVSETKKPTNHQAASVPVVSFTFPKQDANATSKSPAIINIIQFMFLISAAKVKSLERNSFNK